MTKVLSYDLKLNNLKINAICMEIYCTVLYLYVVLTWLQVESEVRSGKQAQTSPHHVQVLISGSVHQLPSLLGSYQSIFPWTFIIAVIRRSSSSLPIPVFFLLTHSEMRLPIALSISSLTLEIEIINALKLIALIRGGHPFKVLMISTDMSILPNCRAEIIIWANLQCTAKIII